MANPLFNDQTTPDREAKKSSGPANVHGTPAPKSLNFEPPKKNEVPTPDIGGGEFKAIESTIPS